MSADRVEAGLKMNSPSYRRGFLSLASASTVGAAALLSEACNFPFQGGAKPTETPSDRPAVQPTSLPRPDIHHFEKMLTQQEIQTFTQALALINGTFQEAYDGAYLEQQPDGTFSKDYQTRYPSLEQWLKTGYKTTSAEQTSIYINGSANFITLDQKLITVERIFDYHLNQLANSQSRGVLVSGMMPDANGGVIVGSPDYLDEYFSLFRIQPTENPAKVNLKSPDYPSNEGVRVPFTTSSNLSGALVVDVYGHYFLNTFIK